MNFGARFSEFGMTGAVFWICQILLFTIGTGEAAGEQFLDMLGVFIGTDNGQSPILKSAAGSLLTVFGLIGIFVTGLVLDMIGSIFFMQEMRIFWWAHLAQYRLVKQHGTKMLTRCCQRLTAFPGRV